jgi:hypothetical protein
MPAFQRNGLSQSSGPITPTLALKMETAYFSEMLATMYKSTWHQNPEEHHHCPHQFGNLKFHTYYIMEAAEFGCPGALV